ncbi:MAG: hypothetical protein A3E01_14805 [Gammaproteobacteria bacterium RIFCSPHIGHO2_12_FULL_63_22]|nr:MAG: hypothetical protein A3E01_14805 [Gammaproteobacteria bacterium RIFCSPHIGHO2_12_FULL_63_22]
MSAWLIAHEAWLKLAVLILLLASLSLLQLALPRRSNERTAHRWFTNMGLIAISTGLIRLFLPAGAVAFAAWVQASGFGMFNLTPGPAWLEVVAAVVLLDLAIYWQHRAFHAIPILWRAHRVHHSDIGFDVSLGLRFHPLEILPSLGFKLALVAALSVAPLAILIYEAMLLGFSLMTHANVALPTAVDAALRRVFVTPDWHRIHHSVHADETNSNYGNILSVWDRLFRSGREQPRDGHARMRIGLHEFRNSQSQSLTGLLRQPFGKACSHSPSADTHHA